MEATNSALTRERFSGREGFLKGNAELVGISARFLDLTIVTVGAMIAHYIRFDAFALVDQYKIALLVGLFAAGSIFPLYDLYKPWRGMSIELEARTVLFAWLTVCLLLPFVVYITKTGEQYSRLWFIYWLGATAILLVISRFLMRKFAQWARSKGFNSRNIVIVGTGELGTQVSENLFRNEWTGINVVGFVDDLDSANDSDIVVNDDHTVPFLGSTFRLAQTLKNRNNRTQDSSKESSWNTRIDQVWVALPLSEEEKIRDVCRLLDDTAVSVVLVPDIFMDSLLNHSVDNLAGMSVVNLRSSPIEGMASTLKMLEDIAISTVALTLMAFPMLLIAIAIKLDSKGPIIFKQRRYGIDGREITVWKFRTMTVMEDGGTVTQAKRMDSRVTRIGSFLRRTSLDELPQFINVLQGRMSVVGPRPHAIAHNEKYRKIVSHYMWRCKVKPGITGWAQVNGWRGETDTQEKMEKRVEFDLEYLKKWSIWFDIKIVFKTMVCVFSQSDVY